MANVPHYRSQFGDTTFTKVFVGGLAWETPTEEMRRYFEQFGEILEAVIITEKNTGKSKGYGFVTFRDPESARGACADPNPVIDGRRANCNIASLGRPRPSPPRGRLNQGANPYQGTTQQGPSSYSGSAASVPPPAPPVMFPPYGYTTYTPDYGYHTGTLYNPQGHQQPQFYHQIYGSTSSPIGNPYTYYYGPYSMQGVSPRGSYSTTAQAQPPQRMPTAAGPSYFYYPSQLEGSFHSFPPMPLQLPASHPFPSTPTTDSQSTSQHASTETGGAGGVASESPKT